MSNKYSKYGNNLSFIDMLFALLIGVFSIFIISILMLGEPKRDDEKLAEDAQLIINLTWDDHSADDMDLWVMSPDQDKIGYNHRENTYIALEHDDLGANFNYIVVDGKKIFIRHNEEDTRIRRMQPGHYVVNVMFYARHEDDETKVKSIGPQEVRVTLLMVNPKTHMLFTRSFFIPDEGQQRTAFSFDVTKDGQVINFTTEEVPFLQFHKAPEDHEGEDEIL